MHEVGKWERITPHHSRLMMRQGDVLTVKIEVNVVHRNGKWFWYPVCHGGRTNWHSFDGPYDTEEGARQYAAEAAAYWVKKNGVEYYA